MFMGCGCHCAESTSTDLIGSSRSSVMGSSESVGSSRADDPDVYPVSGCDYCVDKTAPTTYDVFWDYQGVPGPDRFYKFKNCCADYNSNKTMRIRRVAIPNPPTDILGNVECKFISDIPARFAFLDARVNPFQPIKGCGTIQSLQGVPFPRVVMRLPPIEPLGGVGNPILQIYYGTAWRIFGTAPGAITMQKPTHWVTYTYVPPNNEDWKTLGIRCLQQMTFRFGASATAPIRPQDYTWANSNLFPRTSEWYGAPCEQSQLGGMDLGLPEFITVTPVPA